MKKAAQYFSNLENSWPLGLITNVLLRLVVNPVASGGLWWAKPPQIEIWNTKLVKFVKIECQAPLHERKSPLLTTSWRRFCLCFCQRTFCNEPDLDLHCWWKTKKININILIAKGRLEPLQPPPACAIGSDNFTAAFFVSFIVTVLVPDIEGIQNKVICLWIGTTCSVNATSTCSANLYDIIRRKRSRRAPNLKQPRAPKWKFASAPTRRIAYILWCVLKFIMTFAFQSRHCMLLGEIYVHTASYVALNLVCELCTSSERMLVRLN